MTPILTYANGQLFRDGQPHRMIGGSMHYFRVHPDQWQDRFARLVAMGINTVDTCLVWNFHQRRPEAPDFTGWRDLGRFIDLAGEAGLDVIVRPGPYMCGEWDNGGLPAWVTGIDGVALRSSDPKFLGPVAEWFDALVPVIASRQASRGGPVVAVQVENEYGSYGDDTSYLRWLRDALTSRGITELLYTADGTTELMLDGGTMEGTLATATFGSNPVQAMELLGSRRPEDPFVCAEFWHGWFDHWGEHHHTRDPEEAAADVASILAANGSVSLYMAHGGTNFGLWSGCNYADGALQPTVTSYDSDAPIAEDGSLTAKFHAMREVFKTVVAPLLDLSPEIAAPIATLPQQQLPVRNLGSLLPTLRGASHPVRSPRPLTFEQLGLDAGLVLYRAQPLLPSKQVVLSILGLRDRAQVFVDGEMVGILDRQTGETGLTVIGEGTPVALEILVENQGRINYGPLLGEHKGVLGGVRVDGRFVHTWEQVPVDLDRWLPTEQKDPESTDKAGFAEAVFDCDQPADTHLALPGFTKGFVWINGFLLGRYWERGPQATLYVPAPLLTPGTNRILILELENRGSNVELRTHPDLGPTDPPVQAA